MKWYWILLLVILTALSGFAFGWCVEFWNSPIDEPLCMESGAAAIRSLLSALPADYLALWLPVAGVFAAFALTVIIELAVIAWRLRDAKAA